MTLGERIQELRKQNNISQEALADKLNVSRQAVSKWETGLSNPDTENLIALSDIFNITVEELVGAKSNKSAGDKSEVRKRNTRAFYNILYTLLVIVGIGIAVWYGLVKDGDGQANPADNTTLPTDAIAESGSEYALYWSKDGSDTQQELAIGEQNGAFPWDTSLSGDDTFYTSGDMPGVEFHTVDCNDIEVNYGRNIETGQIFLHSMSTAFPHYETPRGIKVGDSVVELVAEYGDELLVTPEIYSETDDFCMYNSLYAFSNADDGYNSVVFYVLDQQIRGIEVISALDGGPAYSVDNVYTFHLLNGKPDYSQKQEPDLETPSKERKVYVALHTLLNSSMTEEDASTYSETVFQGLRFIDWIAYGKLGEAGKDAETIGELLSWIDAQESFTEDEITDLQLVLQTNIDGIYADMYSTVLYNTFFKNPDIFIECLNNNPDNAENSKKVVVMTVYAAAVTSENLERFEAELHELINCDALSDGAVPWAEQLLARCADPYGETD